MESRKSSRLPEAPKIEGLSEDLQMVGQYLRMCIAEREEERAQSEAAFHRELMSPEEVAREEKEILRSQGLSEEAIEGYLNEKPNPESLRADVAFAEGEIKKYQGLIDDLRRGEYKACLEFLRNDLEVRQQAAQIVKAAGMGQGSPQVRELREARSRALCRYIEILERKLSGTET